MLKAPKLESSLERVLARRDPVGWVAAHMDSYYEQSEEPRVDKGWFHPSAVSNPCDAALAFEFLGIPQPRGAVPARTRRIFDNGHSTEARKQEALRRAGLAQYKNKAERSFEIPQYRIRGECDNAIKNPLTGELFIWEHKTKREDLFDAMRGPDASWIPQVHCYMFGKGILQTIIEVECKNCQAEKRYLVKFDMEIWRGITERLERIVQRLELGVEIARTPLPRDSDCPFYSPSADGTFAGCAGHDFGKVR